MEIVDILTVENKIMSVRKDLRIFMLYLDMLSIKAIDMDKQVEGMNWFICATKGCFK